MRKRKESQVVSSISGGATTTSENEYYVEKDILNLEEGEHMHALI